MDRVRDDAGLSRGFSADRAALIVYLIAGYPDRATSLACLRAAARAGADVIELGVPYGDALADGPVIRKAAHAAMRATTGGFGLARAISLAAEFTESVLAAPPLALMTYLNPMLRLGVEELAEAASNAGVGGFIVPDMPPDNPMAARWLPLSHGRGLDTVFLVAPTSTEERLRLVARASSGFIYCVSATGVTGERAELSSQLADLLARVRSARSVRPPEDPAIPVAVGFGISTPEQAASVARMADGVVVGSAVVRRQDDPAALGAFVGELYEAVEHARE